MDEDFRKAALDYHRLPRPGNLAVEPTSPGVQNSAAKLPRPGNLAVEPTERMAIHFE